MFDKIRTMLSRTQTTSAPITPEDLHDIAETLKAERIRLAEIRELSIAELDRLYRQATGQ